MAAEFQVAIRVQGLTESRIPAARFAAVRFMNLILELGLPPLKLCYLTL
jgi:hypothetical protein